MTEFSFREISCPVCASDTPKHHGWRGGDAHHSGAGVKTAIVRCKNCSHLYPNPMPFPVEDLGKVYVDAENYFHGHDVEKKKSGALGLVLELEKRLGRKGHFLDVGCGVGEILWAGKEQGWDAEGIDPSEEFIEIGKKKLGVDGVVGTLDGVNFPDNHFDAVILSGVIEHLYDPFKTLTEIYRILKPEGWLWLDAPNEDGLYMKLGNLYMRLRGRDWVITLAPTFSPYHVQGFNPASLRQILKRADFEIKELEMFGDISPQIGEQTIQKKIEYHAARFINQADRYMGSGMYMSAWTQKI